MIVYQYLPSKRPRHRSQSTLRGDITGVDWAKVRPQDSARHLNKSLSAFSQGNILEDDPFII